MSVRRIINMLRREPRNAVGHRWWSTSDIFPFRFDTGHVTPSIVRIVA